MSDLCGATDAGVDVGVVAGRVPGISGLMILMRHLDNGHAVFIDSGAFTERVTGIEPDWDTVLGVYESLADLAFGSLNRLYVVAPDKVGDQAGSLNRLARCQSRIQKLASQGVRVIIPYQVGELSGPDLHAAVKAIMGKAPFIVGVPSNRDAMPATMLSTIEHDAFHILGRVQNDADQEARLAAIAQSSPRAEVTADAAWILSRMKKICMETDAIKGRRLGSSKNGNPESLESSRRAAVRRVIRQDNAWGSQPTP